MEQSTWQRLVGSKSKTWRILKKPNPLIRTSHHLLTPLNPVVFKIWSGHFWLPSRINYYLYQIELFQPLVQSARASSGQVHFFKKKFHVKSNSLQNEFLQVQMTPDSNASREEKTVVGEFFSNPYLQKFEYSKTNIRFG